MGRIIYNEDFKKMIVSLLDSGKSIKELTLEFEVSQASIHRWRNEFKATSETDKSESLKIKALEKELKDVKLERDILKKAVSIFSKSDK
jgi:transposase